MCIGSNAPLFRVKHNQVTYPVPSPAILPAGYDAYIHTFKQWAAEQAATVACILIEPQWGSTACAFPWPPVLLKEVIDVSHQYGMLVIADEIMCGLGG